MPILTNILTHHANCTEWLFVRVPEGASDIILGERIATMKPRGGSKWTKKELGIWYTKPGYNGFSSSTCFVPLYSSAYTLIGLASELKHSDVEPMLQCESDVYYNYEWKHYGFVYPLGSFLSLLTSHNLQPETTVVLKRKG